LEIDGFTIEIVRSKARKRTLSARLISEKEIKVLTPYSVSSDFLDDFIKKTVKKFSKHKTQSLSEPGELKKRALMLKCKFIPEAPNFSISFSGSLRTTWGKCFFTRREIIINPVLSTFPLWVSDMVIIHEIAHLIYPNHGKEFRLLVSRYRLKERATGYLIAKGLRAEAPQQIKPEKFL
jgi:predicted metal-dependent hydrolase